MRWSKPFVRESQVELERAEPGEMSDNTIQACYEVHGQLYHRLRWRP